MGRRTAPTPFLYTKENQNNNELLIFGVLLGYKQWFETMRCKNCGWPNKPNETVCVKCGSPLDADTQVDYGYEGGYQSQQPINNGEDGLKKTVMENQVFGPSVNDPIEPETPTVSENSCPKCGYPMRAGVLKCPNCNYSPTTSNSQQPISAPNGGGYQRHPTRMAQPADEPEPVFKQTRKVVTEGGVYRGTINPYMMNYQAEPSFILKPIQRMNERKPVENTEFEGSEVSLKRDNTEPGNPTISSKGQATVTHKDGHWYIEDKSEQKTTFVQASHLTELHDGDIILLGNRLFEFKEQ